jgi:hypothetical protein
MESVEEAIAVLRLKIAETQKIRKRQETELAELAQALENIQRHTRETTRLTLENFQADEQEKRRPRLETTIEQKKVAKEQKRRLLLAKVQKEKRNYIEIRREKRLAELRLEFLQKEEDEDSVLPSRDEQHNSYILRAYEACTKFALTNPNPYPFFTLFFFFSIHL